MNLKAPVRNLLKGLASIATGTALSVFYSPVLTGVQAGFPCPSGSFIGSEKTKETIAFFPHTIDGGLATIYNSGNRPPACR